VGIERIEVIVTDFPTRLVRHNSGGVYDTGGSGSLVGKPVLVKIYADGVVGYGQIRPISPGHFMPDTVYSMVGAITDFYGPRLLGLDIFDVESVVTMFDRMLPANANARAAIDHALHDAMGKATKRPVYSLLGGLCQKQIPLEWSVSMADDPQMMVGDATQAVEQFGIRVLCLKAGSKAGWKEDLKKFAAVRKAVGDDVVIGIDPNEAWSVDTTIRAIQEFAKYELGYIEQPVKRHDLAGMAAIRREAHGIPLLADEGCMTVENAYALAHHEACDVFCIKLYKVGGFGPAKKIAAVAEAANLQVNIGGLAVWSQLEAAAGVHFYASLPVHRVMPAAEFIGGLGLMGPDPLVSETDFVVRDGHVSVPGGAGLGVRIDDRSVERLTLRREIVK